MASKKVTISVAYVAVFVQLATYVAHDTGRLSEGSLYWSLLYASGITLLGAVIWLARLRSRGAQI
jgi:hypothetical protein